MEGQPGRREEVGLSVAFALDRFQTLDLAVVVTSLNSTQGFSYAFSQAAGLNLNLEIRYNESPDA